MWVIKLEGGKKAQWLNSKVKKKRKNKFIIKKIENWKLRRMKQQEERKKS